MTAHLVKVNGGSIRDSVGELFEAIGFAPRGKIFIKPNLCAREAGLASENSDVRFIKALAEFLSDKGCEVIIGHRANLPTKDLTFPFKKVIQIAGLHKLKGIKNVKVIDLDKAPMKIVSFHGITFHMPKIIFEADSYINLAKMKTHMQTYVSLSLKNQMGLILPAERMKVHRTDLSKLVAYLGKVVKPDVSIIEGLIAMEGNGPHHGINKKVGIVTAGTDMVELDSFTSYIMGLDWRKAEHIIVAARIGVGKPVKAEKLQAYRNLRQKFRPAEQFIKKGRALYTWPTSGCPGCLKALEEAARHLRKRPETVLKFFFRTFIPTNLVLGNCNSLRRGALKGKTIGFGNCSREFCGKYGIMHFGGCPMSSKEIEKILEKVF